MKDNVPDNIKNRLEDASPEELGYRPDREGMWNRIAPGPAKRTMPFLRWATHAAAVAAGLLLGFFLWTGSGREQAPGLAQQEHIPPAQVIRDTVYLAATPAAAAQLPAAAAPGRTAAHKTDGQQATGIPVRYPKQEPEIAEHTPVQQQPAPEENLLAHQPPARSGPAVLHLADIGNENARSRTKQKAPALFNIIPILAEPADQSETLTMSVSETLFRPRN